MKTIVFFSFKGGLGRTQALINVAALLARSQNKKANNRGNFVVAVDLDLHAPGLSLSDSMRPSKEHLAHLPPDTLVGKQGLIHFLDATLSEQADQVVPELANMAFRPQAFERAAARDEGAPMQGLWRAKGDLMFLPLAPADALTSGGEYFDLVERVETRLHEMKQGLKQGDGAEQAGAVTISPMLEWIKEQALNIRSNRSDWGVNGLDPATLEPDYLLIDARTGITQVSDFLISGSVDQAVVLSGFNDQNLKGLELILERFKSAFHSQDLWLSKLLVALSPMPDAEETLRQERLGIVRTLLGRYTIKNAMFGGRADFEATVATIPYHPLLALSDDILALEHPDARPVAAYRTIVDWLNRDNLAVGKARTGFGVAKAGVDLGRKDSGDDSAPGDGSEPMTPVPELPPGKRQDLGEPSLERVTQKVLRWNHFFPAMQERDLIPEKAAGQPANPQAFLNYLANSLSLSHGEKMRVLRELPNLSQFQVDAMEDVFADERREYLGIEEDETRIIAGLQGKALAEWMACLSRWQASGEWQARAELESGLLDQLALLTANEVGGAAHGEFWGGLLDGLDRVLPLAADPTLERLATRFHDNLPGKPGILRQRGLFRERMGQASGGNPSLLESAIEDFNAEFEMLRKARPGARDHLAQLRYFVARVHHGGRRYQPALQQLSVALAMANTEGPAGLPKLHDGNTGEPLDRSLMLQILFLQGRCHLDLAQYTEALAAFSSALPYQGRDANEKGELGLWISISLIALDQLDDAVAETLRMEAALRDSKASSHLQDFALSYRIEAHLRRADWPAAQQAWVERTALIDAATEKAPLQMLNDWRGSQALLQGRLRWGQGQPDDARKAFYRARKMCPDSLRLEAELGLAACGWRLDGKMDDAEFQRIADALGAANQPQDEADALALWAEGLSSLGQAERAREVAGRAAEVARNHTAGWVLRRLIALGLTPAQSQD